MLLNVNHVPRFSESEAERLARELYGVGGKARKLSSERDQNFYLEDVSGSGFVLKIAAAGERREMLDAQNRAMEHVGNRGSDVLCPRVKTTLSGEQIATAKNQVGAEHFVRLVTWIPGITLADDLSAAMPDSLRQGRTAGQA